MENENINKEFKHAMFLVPFGAYEEMKEAIISRCLITPMVYNNWLNGRTRIQEKYYPIIEDCLGKKIF